MQRLKILFASLLLASFFITSAQADNLVVGGKNYTEQLVMASITSQYLEALGYQVTKRDGMGSAVIRRAQESGQIDLYWEYTGTSLFVFNKVTESLTPEESYQRVKSLDAKKDLIWLNPSNSNNTYALAMRAEDVKTSGIKTLPDFAAAIKAGKKLKVGLDTEFYSRDDGWRPLQKAYNFSIGRRDASGYFR